MSYKKHTGCPISFSTASFGDKWTLLILREIVLFQKRYYHEFIDIDESISTNILADRLKDMEKRGFIKKRNDPDNKRKLIYEPTEKALDLIPVFVEMILWAEKHDPLTKVTKDHVEEFTKHRAKTIKHLRKQCKPLK